MGETAVSLILASRGDDIVPHEHSKNFIYNNATSYYIYFDHSGHGGYHSTASKAELLATVFSFFSRIGHDQLTRPK